MRPSTLFQAVKRLVEGNEADAVSEFLDAFYSEPDRDARVAMLAQEPPLTHSPQLDAWIGGVAEYLSRRYRLGSGPAWAFAPSRILKEPWHTLEGATPAVVEYLSFVSPAEFKHRNVFTEEVPLRRARLG